MQPWIVARSSDSFPCELLDFDTAQFVCLDMFFGGAAATDIPRAPCSHHDLGECGCPSEVVSLVACACCSNAVCCAFALWTKVAIGFQSEPRERECFRPRRTTIPTTMTVAATRFVSTAAVLIHCHHDPRRHRSDSHHPSRLPACPRCWWRWRRWWRWWLSSLSPAAARGIRSLCFLSSLLVFDSGTEQCHITGIASLPIEHAKAVVHSMT